MPDGTTASPLDPTVRGYLRRVIRFAVRRDAPADPSDVPVWSLCVPYVLWNEECRYDGRTFADTHSAGLGTLARTVLPLRFLYLASLLAFPLVSLLRGLKRGTGALRYLRDAMRRPDLVGFFPAADFTDEELRFARPDYALAMCHAYDHARKRAPHLRLDDKRHFVETLKNAGFPVPEGLTPAAALAGSEAVVVKDPDEDLGYGVFVATPEELRELPNLDHLILQRRLVNHPVLRAVYPPNAPLSSFRVITTRAPDGSLAVSRCAIRMGMDGSDVDNTAQGGIWAGVHPRTGVVGKGIRKKTFGKWKAGAPLRDTEHPDSGKRFEGLQIPWFSECCALALKAHAALAPDAPSLGWDLSLSETPPVFLEVNVWAACYDYDPPDDAFTPAAHTVVAHRRGK